MKQPDPFDFWYAVNNTEIVLMPRQHLETFGRTILNYHLVTELMDTVNHTRVREGRIEAHPPQIVTPEAYSRTVVEGFGEEARRFVEWLKEHENDVRILRYGYVLAKKDYNEHVLKENIRSVVESVKDRVRQRSDPFGAVVVGVDKPWDVCLVKLFWEVIRQSAPANVMEMERGRRLEIEAEFLAAARDPARVKRLGQKLQEYKLFKEYEDRFFALVKGGAAK